MFLRFLVQIQATGRAASKPLPDSSMATDDTLRMDEQASDREHAELSPSDMEEEVPSVPETGTSAAGEVGIEDATDEELLRGA